MILSTDNLDSLNSLAGWAHILPAEGLFNLSCFFSKSDLTEPSVVASISIICVHSEPVLIASDSLLEFCSWVQWFRKISLKIKRNVNGVNLLVPV